MRYDIQPGSIIASRALSWVEGGDWDLVFVIWVGQDVEEMVGGWRRV